MKNKRQRMTCVPSNEKIFKIGALIFAAGALLQLLTYLKPIFSSFWKEGTAAGINTLLICCLSIAAAAMMYFAENYKLSFASFVLLLSGLAGGVRSMLFWAELLFFLSCTGCAFSKPAKLLKKLQTPMLCLVSALLILLGFAGALLNFEKPVIGHLGLLIKYAGMFVVLINTIGIPKPSSSELKLNAVVTRPGSKGFRVGVILLALDLVLMFLVNLTGLMDALDHDIGSILLSWGPVILYIVLIFLLWSEKHSSRFWLDVILMSMIFMSRGFGGGYPGMLFLFMLIPAIGFTGNASLLKNEKIKLSAADAAVLFVLLLLTISDIRTIAVDAKHLFAAVPKVAGVKSLFPVRIKYFAEGLSETMRSTGILRSVGIALLLLFSGIEEIETTIISKIKVLLGKIGHINRYFFRDVGGKIQKLAYGVGTFFLFVMLLAMCGALICFVLFMLCTLGTAVGEIIDVEFVAVLYCLGAAVVALLQAMMCWFVYAYGQITDDIRQLRSSKSQTLSAAEAEDDDELPEL